MVARIILNNEPGTSPLVECLEYIGELSPVELGYMNTWNHGPRYNFDL